MVAQPTPNRLPDCTGVSIGPRPFGHGNFAIIIEMVATIIGFNWATSFRTWKSSSGNCHGASRGNFQFQLGHVLSDMEIEMAITGNDLIRWVSIGPRPFGHGNIIPVIFRGPFTGFQLGHVLSDMEIVMASPLATADVVMIMFQLGHVLSDMEIFGLYLTFGLTILGFQLGHVLSDMEICGAGSYSRAIGGVSIGPRPFGHGNAALLAEIHQSRKEVSIGPRPFGHGNGQYSKYRPPCIALARFNWATSFRTWKW